MYHNLKWTESEKKQARKTFELALQEELEETLLDFKRRAAAAKDAQQMWAVAEYLESKRRHIDDKYDYRYSQLILVFGRLLREKRITEEQLRHLDEEKRSIIRKIATL